ncbi:hypothetical protein ABE236_18345 [Priestia endophytica]|uniref:hypothetical protein n=1 Tax=Priestia endophytica TaxID=135735 RepID=UPI003D295007
MQVTTNHAQLTLFNSRNGEELFQNRSQVNSLKKKYITLIDEKMAEEGTRLTKAQKDILGLLVYNTCVTGVQSISLARLVDKSGYSRATVTRAKKAIVELGFFEVGYLGDEQKGHYVFVLKLHTNYKQVMQFLFNETSCEQSNETSSKAETPWESKAKGQENVPTLYTFNTLKQEKDNKESVTREIEDKEDKREEYMNAAQKKLFYKIKGGEYHSLIENDADRIALRVGKDFNMLKALKAVIKLDTALKAQTADDELTSIPSLFKDLFDKELMKAANPAPKAEVQQQPKVTIPFYNWLEN